MQNNDLIFRAAAIEQIKRMPYWFTPDGYCALTYDDVEAAINNLPAVDAVPVVRCKDCKYAHLNDDNECKWCDRISALTDEGEPYYVPVFPPDWYCAYGERDC